MCHRAVIRDDAVPLVLRASLPLAGRSAHPQATLDETSGVTRVKRTGVPL
jgi:hypothetical protein